MPNPPLSDQRPPVSQRTVLTVIIGGLLLWALYVAIGAYRATLGFAGAVMVLLFMAAFVGFWLLLLWTQGRNKKP
jgi:hypothetical protein